MVNLGHIVDICQQKIWKSVKNTNYDIRNFDQNPENVSKNITSFDNSVVLAGMSCSPFGWCQSSWEKFADIFRPYDWNISLADKKTPIFRSHERNIKRTDTQPTSPAHMNKM